MKYLFFFSLFFYSILSAQTEPNVIYANGDTSINRSPYYFLKSIASRDTIRINGLTGGITTNRIEGFTIGRTIKFHSIDNRDYRTMVLTDNPDTIRIIIDKDTIYTKEYYLKEFIKRYFKIVVNEIE